MNSLEQSESASRRSPASGGSASRSYWLYVWRGSKYRGGAPVEYSEPPQKFMASCDEEAAEMAAERAADAVIWELHDGNAMDEKTKQIASKHRPLVMPNGEVCDGGRKTSELNQDANRHSQH